MSKLYVFVAVGLAACGAPTPEDQALERVEIALDGPIARAIIGRTGDVNVAIHRANQYRTDENAERPLRLSDDDVRYAHHAVEQCIRLGYCSSLAAADRRAMSHLDRLYTFTEAKGEERGISLEPQAIEFGVNVSADLAQIISDIIGAIAGTAEGIGQAAQRIQDTMLCAIELGERVLPGTLQVLEAEDLGVYACRVACVQSSSAATMAWCFDDPHYFVDGGPDVVAGRMARHLLEECAPINLDDLERAGGCLF